MSANEAMATAPKASPFLGHALPLLPNPLCFLASLPDHGDLVRIRIGPFRVIVICDPELTRQVLLDDRTYDKGGLFVERAAESIGEGLVTCPHRQHRLAQPAFHQSRFPAYGQTMIEQIAAVVDEWHDGQVIDVLSEIPYLIHHRADLHRDPERFHPERWGEDRDAPPFADP